LAKEAVVALPRRTRALVGAILPLIIAVLMIGVGVSDLGDDIKCGNRTMSPSDMCRVSENGNNSLRGYTTMKNDQHGQAKWYLLGGALALFAGGAATWKQLRRTAA
jgi:hypothetical protein